jgi:hypothetical protein
VLSARKGFDGNGVSEFCEGFQVYTVDGLVADRIVVMLSRIKAAMASSAAGELGVEVLKLVKAEFVTLTELCEGFHVLSVDVLGADRLVVLLY